MASTVLDSLLFRDSFGTPAMRGIFEDAALLARWHEVAAEQIIANVEAASKDENPLAQLLRRVFGERLTLERAVRTWASVDTAARAAVQAIDRVHGALRRLATVPLGPRWVADREHRPRVSVREPSWPDLVSLGVDEIRRTGAGSLQVSRRLRAMLVDLSSVAPAHRRDPIERELRLLDASDSRSFPDGDDLRLAGTPDPQGMGSFPPDAAAGAVSPPS